MCGKSYFDDDSALNVTTWCGGLMNNKPRKICRIDGAQETKHFVQIVNGKTYQQQVQIKATLMNHNAAFLGTSPCRSNESEWSESKEIFDALDVATVVIGGVDVGKKSTGKDIIRVDIEYRDNWDFSRKGTIDPNRLVFGIDVI